MSNTPNFDLKVSQILDSLKPGERVCDLTGEKWVMDEDEIKQYRIFNVPPSKYSPLTRWRLMTAYFCGWQWWYNPHAETGKPVLSYIHPASGYKVLPDKEWFDKDFSHIIADYDSNRSFFEQFDEFNKQVPMSASKDIKPTYNSISLVSLGCEDSYFVLASDTKRSINCSCTNNTEDSAEIYLSKDIFNSYNVVNSYRIHGCKYVRESFDCIDSAFLFDCRNCEYCFGSSNKRYKKYLWFNKQLTKEEYEKRISEVDFGCRSSVNIYMEQFHQMIEKDTIWPENFNEAVENCTGEYLVGCTNLTNCFAVKPGSRDLCYVAYGHGACNDCAFCAGPHLCSFCYYSVPSECTRSYFCYETFKCGYVEYCMNCINCEHCFACSGLRHKRYCIFNKQYTENEYWEKLDEIKCNMLERGDYGEYFPAKYSPSYFPDAGALVFDASDMGKIFGALDFDPESMGAIGKELTETTNIRNVSEIPDCIDDLDSVEWVGVPILDTTVNRRFGFIKQEIDFYKKHRLAPPNVHFIPRVKQLYWEGNLGVFEEVTCSQCEKNIRVARNKTYPNRTIYCKSCYYKYLEQNS
ncbi:MAG: hypothetical protein ABIH67_05595 [Candidatus Uhrbacteria bacterium]